MSFQCECPKCGAKFEVEHEKLVCARCPKCSSFEVTLLDEEEKKE